MGPIFAEEFVKLKFEVSSTFAVFAPLGDYAQLCPDEYDLSALYL